MDGFSILGAASKREAIQESVKFSIKMRENWRLKFVRDSCNFHAVPTVSLLPFDLPSPSPERALGG